MANATPREGDDRRRDRHHEEDDRRHGEHGEEHHGGNYGNPSRYAGRSRTGPRHGYGPYAPEHADESGFSQGERGGSKPTGNHNEWERRAYESQQRSGPHRGRGPKGYKRSDERIREDVCDALTDAAHLDASSIEVMVKDGEVTLSGTVSDRGDRREAEDMVERRSGVQHVQNNIRVEQKTSSSRQNSDKTQSRR